MQRQPIAARLHIAFWPIAAQKPHCKAVVAIQTPARRVKWQNTMVRIAKIWENSKNEG